jgi:AcrR family transcriptional regulator
VVDDAAEVAAGRRTLPIVGLPPVERADAARNRRVIFAAAEKIITERGIEDLSMDEVAAAAGVGVGTVYRRFRDRGGLAYALLDERERELQAAFLSGPPPLGPGAAPLERIRAFLHAFVDRLEVQAALLVIAETSTPTARYHSGAYAAHHVHLATLVTEARPEADAHYLADALLAPLAAGLFIHQRQNHAMDIERIKAGLDDLLAGLPMSTP